MSRESDKIFVTLGIEKAGALHIKHPIVSIDWRIGDADAKVVHCETEVPTSCEWDKKKIFVALDIEKAGALHIKHPIVSIGWCIGDADGKVLCKDRINLNVKWPTIEQNPDVRDYGDFEPRCWDEFWSKRPRDLIDSMKANAYEQKKGIEQFARLLDFLETEYPSPNHEIVFLTDNPAFDIAALDVALELQVGRMPIRYDSKGRYRSIQIPDEAMHLLSAHDARDLVRAYVDCVVKHDHDPSNDAEHVYRQYLLVLMLQNFVQKRLSFVPLIDASKDKRRV